MNCWLCINDFVGQIEGFKLHVNHSTRPFISRIRQTPEVASKPDRIKKDLDQVKKLVDLLEEEHHRVMNFKPPKSDVSGDAEDQVNGNNVATDVDARMLEGNVAEEVESKDKGSKAVERRIAVLAAQLTVSGNEDETDGLELKKVVLLNYHFKLLSQ